MGGMKTSEIQCLEHPNGSMEIVIDGEQRGRWDSAKDLGLYLGICLVHIDDLEKQVLREKYRYSSPKTL